MYLVEEMKNIFICPTMLQCRAKIDVVIIPLYVQTWLQEGMNKNKKNMIFVLPPYRCNRRWTHMNIVWW